MHKFNSTTVHENGLHVYIAEQKMYFFENGLIKATFDISTSKKPPSCQANSFGTPWGRHTICQKIGGDMPLGMVFESREPIGTFYWEMENLEKTYITSRILRLQGLEEGLNKGAGCDTFERYIYIHGTNKEDLVGTPASAGCINMKNQDVIDLYNQVAENTLVIIYA